MLDGPESTPGPRLSVALVLGLPSQIRRRGIEAQGEIALGFARLEVAADTPVSYTHLTLPTICSV